MPDPTVPPAAHVAPVPAPGTPTGARPADGSGERPGPAFGLGRDPRRRDPGRTMALLAGGLVGLVLAVFIGLDTVDQTSGKGRRDEHRAFPAAVTHLRLDSDSGDIRLVGTTERTIVVDARLRGTVRLPRLATRVEGNTAVVGSSCHSWFWECSADYVVRVPRNTVVEVRASSGDIRAAGLDGTVRLHSSSGDVTAAQPRGDLDASSGSGDIWIDEAETRRVSASTSAGDVRVELDAVPEEVDARSSAGDVRITVPRGDTVYDAAVSTSGGDQRMAVNYSPTATRRLRATTSAGDAVIVYGPGS